MKAERRHQLQDNELAKQLETLPEKLQRHASKIILAITVVLLCVFIYRYRVKSANDRIVALASATNTAQVGPRELRRLDAQFLPPEQIAISRNELTNMVNNAIDTILREAEGTDGAALRAEALVAKGDLNWSLANATPLPGATTQQSLRLPRSTDEYLKAAEAAYRDVLNAYANQKLAWVSAQFGLAAIAENRADWESARTAYSAIVNNKDLPQSFQQQARAKLLVLNEIQGPVLLSSYPATAPSTQATTNANGATTMPMTQVDRTSSDLDSAARTPSTRPTTNP